MSPFGAPQLTNTRSGRLAFDMMEIEDLILDNAPVDLMSTDQVMRELTSSTHHLAATLRKMVPKARDGPGSAEKPDSDNDVLGDTQRTSAQSDTEVAAIPSLPRVSLGPMDNALRAASSSGLLDEGRTERNTYPELRSSDYIYDCVVLGFLDVVGGLRMSPP